MPTTGYDWTNGKVTGNKLYAVEWNELVDELDALLLDLLEVVGSGIVAATDLNGTDAGSGNLNVSAGRAVIGSAGARVIVGNDGESITDLPNGTSTVYILKDGTLTHDLSADPAPANSEPCIEVVKAGGLITSIDNTPSGRTNLIGMHAARVKAAGAPGYLEDLITSSDASVTITESGGVLDLSVPYTAETEVVFGPYRATLVLGQLTHVEVDMSAAGTMSDRHFEQVLTCDQAHVECNPETSRKSTGRMAFTVMIHPDDAEAGTYGTSTQVEFYARAKGVWSGTAGPFTGDSYWSTDAIVDTGAVDLATEVTGTLGVDHGGTGGTTQAAARTGLGLGTLSTQNADSIAVTGGTLDGVNLTDIGTISFNNAATARAALGIGTMGVQDANAVAITGGSISGINMSTDVLTSGTLSTDRFSAYADLTAESKIGTAADQVAAGNHSHTVAPAGSDTQLQFNDGGVRAGTAGLTWDKTNYTLRLEDGYFFAADGDNNYPTSGAGLGMVCHGNIGYFVCRNYDTASYQQLNIEASSIRIGWGPVYIGADSACDANYYLQLPNDLTKAAKAYAWDTYASSLEWKADVQEIAGATALLRGVRGIRYQHNYPDVDGQPHPMNGQQAIGVSAEELDTLGLPGLVTKGPDGIYRSINMTLLIPVLVQALREIDGRVSALEG